MRVRSDAGWEISFVDEGPDITRMEVSRGQVSEHFLAVRPRLFGVTSTYTARAI